MDSADCRQAIIQFILMTIEEDSASRFSNWREYRHNRKAHFLLIIKAMKCKASGFSIKYQSEWLIPLPSVADIMNFE